MADRWHIAKSGPEGVKQFGPFTSEQLRQLVSAGRLQAADLIWQEGTSSWIAAGAAGLFPGPLAAVQPSPAWPSSPPQPVSSFGSGVPTHAHPLAAHLPQADRLEGFWYAIVWLSLLVPFVGTWIIVILSSVMYYVWRREYPTKAKTINLHGWLAFAVGNTVCCLGWMGLSALQPGGGKTQTVVPPPAAASFGQELNFQGGQLFFTSTVRREEAERLGRFLVSEQYFDGDPKTVQLDKQGRTYAVRMVMKKGLDQDREVIDLARLLASRISADVFSSAPVDIHLCDENLVTIRVVVPFR